ncbi:hyaluronidase-1 isoform X2 [Ascaphus truei]
MVLTPELSSSLPPPFALSLLLLFLSPAGSDPVLSQRPFVTAWNAPTRRCWDTFGVALDLGAFDISINQNHSFIGNEVVIFYNTQLGEYPYYAQDGSPVNGGLPQNASIEEHLTKARTDIEAAILDPAFKGVAVVDWENWRPLWSRNWNQMKVYVRHSLELVSQQQPYWPRKKVRKVAKRQFEGAARDLMRSTLELGSRLRPGGLWGFYGFPNCYNYEYKNASSNYTGVCPEAEVRRNDRLGWMWGASRVLYPDIYLEQRLKLSENVGKFVQYRVQEAFRVAKAAPGGTLPILPYARIVYTYSMDFLAQEDLIQTIGQSAALGAAGIILWGNADYSKSKDSCLAVKAYIDDTLGAYVVNVTSGALLCSRALCAGNGRCVRKDPASEAYLHLHPGSYNIKRHTLGSGYLVSGEITQRDTEHMGTQFRCRCYPGWGGTDCTQGTDW